MQELRINIHLTTHVARKTFTSTVLLGNNIPLKVASTLLGHSDSKITEKYYAEVSNDLLEQHAEALFNIFKK
ncbi:MAG: tyrosine-type recombinase/integrase [Saprospiraceae bacterium]|nr:tyrosine-type recombinase/integrase [Saprospiraceae bacterium]MBK8547909.1 tyrosine-type recombinase/integrase [Saprospiraceae bacterium]